MAPRTPLGPPVLTALAHGNVAHSPSHAPSHAPSQIRADRAERGDQGFQSNSISFSFPRIDQHLVVPEVSRTELIDGREVIDVGSLPPHADAQALAGFLLAAHVLRAYVVATELLTRSAVDSDFATDVCIRKRGTDPETGSRYLEELSFEIVNEQSTNDVTSKARNLSRRGVRRIFAIFVKAAEICEWSKSKGEFVQLDKNGMFEDPVFVRPMAIKALVDSTLAEADNEVAKALIAKQNPEIVKLQHEAEQGGRTKGLDEGHKKGLDEGHKKGLDEGHKKGLDEGHKKGLDEGLDVGRNMLRHLLAQRFGELPTVIESRISLANAEQLGRWTTRLFSAASIEQLFALESAV